MKTKFNHLTFVVAIMTLVSACATNKGDVLEDKAAESMSAVQLDITRPPEFVKRNQDVGETNPDKTISMEEWQKERDDKN